LTDAPFAVNIPLYNRRSPDFLDIALAERVPALIGSQGGPQAHLTRFREAGIRWLHVCASPRHAEKAAQAGVDAIIAVGAEAGGHPPPDEVGTLVVVRAVCQAVDVPVIAGGGVADGAGMAALFCLGAEGVQFGTRFLLTPEATVHERYKSMALAADIADTTLVGRGRLPVRMLRNAFTREVAQAEAAGMEAAALQTLIDGRTLRHAALDGDVEQGKVEVGQSVGLIDTLVPAGRLVHQLMNEFHAARRRLAELA
jgi:enoyl-[acyl-carrier protein] reductase II